MRKVDVYKWEQVENKAFHEKVFDCTGTFLKFGIDYEEFKSGPAMYSTAIVELDDGTLRSVYVEMIKFLEPEK